MVAGGNGVVRYGIRTDETHIFGFIVIVELLRRLVSRGCDAIGTGLFLGSTSSDSDILRGGLCGQAIVFGAATIPSTTAASTAAPAAILAAAITSASVSIASSARSLATAAASC